MMKTFLLFLLFSKNRKSNENMKFLMKIRNKNRKLEIRQTDPEDKLIPWILFLCSNYWSSTKTCYNRTFSHQETM